MKNIISHLYFKLNYSLMLRAILMISIILSSTLVMLPLTNNNAFAGKEKPHLFSPYLSKILGAKWWQWALEIPEPRNPLIDANPCNVNQHGYFFFLAGTLGGDPVERTCTIPKGKAIFFPVYNYFQTFGPQPPGNGSSNRSGSDKDSKRWR